MAKTLNLIPALWLALCLIGAAVEWLSQPVE